MTAPTPADYVADAEETLGKARAMLAQAQSNDKEWNHRVLRLTGHLRNIRAWASAGGTGKRPRKPTWTAE